MQNKKTTKKYYFSVEGETEHWYLKWLQDMINKTEASEFMVSIDCPVNKNPVKRVKAMNVTRKIVIYHFFDYESDEKIHVKRFIETMDNMKKAQNYKQVIYKSGYTNFTFDLWMILHVMDCNSTYAHRKQYIIPINKAYGEHFEDMDEYKKESNFKRCLSKLSLQDVISAVKRAKAIEKRNQDNGYVLHQYKGYKYYKENPSLAAWEAIEKILQDCKLI